jgi:hypothetical protein
MTVADIPTGGSYYGYRGQTYPAVAVAADWVGLPLDGDGTPTERFPDAIEFVTGASGPWAKVPRDALDAAYTRHVHARWRDVPVAVGSIVRRGPTRGLVVISYEGSDPAEAVAAGLDGDQFNGWSAKVDPAEVEIVRDEMVQRPVKHS